MEIAVIGAGASGMLAALTAAEDGGNRVTLYERQARCGRKLAATGNGRCNLTNTNACPDSYLGSDPGFAAPALEAFGVSETLEYFRGLGLLTVTEADGRVYPLSDSANSVVDVLRLALAPAGVELRASGEVTAVEPGFRVVCGGEKFRADRVIVACGGMAGATLGGAALGYSLLEALGHRRTKLYPALVQIKTVNTHTRALKGVRADAGVALVAGGRTVASSSGEVQFLDYGVSGPAIFDVSRAASEAKGERLLRLDLLRDYAADEIAAMLALKREKNPELALEDLLTGLVHNRLGRVMIRYGGRALNATAARLTDSDLLSVAKDLKRFELPVIGARGFDSAQVTAGGIATADFDPHTLESRLVPGLFACGEVLDIDGGCGGYNLQWAWSSGRLAGRLGKR